MTRTAKVLALLATVALLAAGTPASADEPVRTPPVPELDAGSASLSEAGKALAARVSLADAPRYGLSVEIEPRSGRLRASMHASLPAAARNHLVFRMFPGLVKPDANVRISRARVNGEDAKVELRGGRLELPNARRESRVEVELSFSYRIPEIAPPDPLEALGTEGLSPATIGLLGRHGDIVTLGHWFPIWLPPGAVDDADPHGFGDIGNFPAAVIRAEVRVPRRWTVLSGGTTSSSVQDQDRTVSTEEGVGLRDLSLVVGRHLASIEIKVGDVTLRVTAPESSRDQLEQAGTEAAAAVALYSERFAPYPWSELDVITVPLGGSVGGMEWPGAVWIGSTIFAGGIPGLEGLNLGGDPNDPNNPLNGLEDIFATLGLDNMREFSIAHEVAHQWWHALVGNDSIAAPFIDEPLAQYSACVELRNRVANADCSPFIDQQYSAMRSSAIADAPADQASDRFTSSLQYGGVVYGKAPGFYRALEALLGADAVTAGLRALATEHAWGEVGPDDLLAAFKGVAPERTADIDALWKRWMDETHGDEDVVASTTATPGIDPQLLEELIKQLQQLGDLFPTGEPPARVRP